MITVRSWLFGALAFALGAAAWQPVSAATLYLNPTSPVDGINWSITLTNPANTPLVEWAYYDSNFSNQSAANVKTTVENWFGVSLSSVVTQVDSIGGGSSYTYSGAPADTFYFHIGGGAFAFIFNDPVTGFTFAENGAGLSNLRAYNCTGDCPEAGPSPVPIPAALPLLASALFGGGLVAWRKKRRKEAERVIS